MRLKSNFGFMKSEHIGLRALSAFWTFHGTAEVYRYMLLSGKVVVHHICAYDIIYVCEHSSPDMCPQPESCPFASNSAFLCALKCPNGIKPWPLPTKWLGEWWWILSLGPGLEVKILASSSPSPVCFLSLKDRLPGVGKMVKESMHWLGYRYQSILIITKASFC